MRATILPLTDSEVKCFSSLLPNYFHFYVLKMQYCFTMARREHCNRNTPNPKYSHLITSGG